MAAAASRGSVRRLASALRDLTGAAAAGVEATALARASADAADAAPPEEASRLYEHFTARVRATGLTVGTGVFRATMEVRLVDHGPVTLLLDSRKGF